MDCEYCGSRDQTGKACSKCGAKLPEKIPWHEQIYKSEPFFYEGYICYSLSNPMNDICEVQFWLGKELIERIVVSHEILREQVAEYEDPIPFFFDLFKVARGEKEVIEFQEKNKIYPASFEIRRIENKEKQELVSLPYKEYLKAVLKKG